MIVRAPTPTEAVDTADADRLPAGLVLGAATLTVSDLARSVAFYETVVGLRVLARGGGAASLGGAGGAAILELVERAGATPKPRAAAGLFHVAILLPERRDLAVALARLRRRGVRLGASDHLVSEALYLDDPDGNGLEIYRDRPRADWRFENGRVRMATEPLNAPDLLALLAGDEDLDAPTPADTRIGHVHLQVGDLEAARAFWVDALGFAPTTTYPGALFVSAGGYHHHVALNVWSSRGGGAPPADSAGLRGFEAVLPAAADVAAAAARVSAAGFATDAVDGGFAAADPWGARIVVRAARA